MTWRWQSLLAGGAILALSGVASGNSARNIGPLADIDEVSVEAMIGDALGVQADPGIPLLDSDRKGAEDLKAALIASASAHLRKAGVRVVERSDSVVEFNLFGGKFKRSGGNKNFFMLQIMVCPPGRDRCSQEATTLGVVDEQGLTQTVVSAALSTLDEFISDRAAYREAKPNLRGAPPN